MIAFDIAVVAQKVKVEMLLYDGRHDKSEKVGWWWWCCWVSSRSGWLLELLTELTRVPCGGEVPG